MQLPNPDNVKPLTQNWAIEPFCKWDSILPLSFLLGGVRGGREFKYEAVCWNVQYGLESAQMSFPWTVCVHLWSQQESRSAIWLPFEILHDQAGRSYPLTWNFTFEKLVCLPKAGSACKRDHFLVRNFEFERLDVHIDCGFLFALKSFYLTATVRVQ